MGLLDGKVAIITGAGGGLGRAYALLFAKEGARVVVNDLGGSREGAGGGSAMADLVVNEIKELGGQAVANYASVSDPEGAKSIVDDAMNAWGRLDICVNNAGILRDKTLLKLEISNFDLVMAVHARGTYLVGQAAAAAMRAGSNGGSIINTSSIAGLKGNFGQTNYACAKAGIYGMTQVWSQELQRFGIRSNAIAPMAKTRMTDDISAVPDDITPDQIAPVALFLASDLSENVNGRVFGAHGPHVFEYHMQLSPGVDLGDGVWTASSIADKLDEISRISAPKAGDGAPKAADPVERCAALFLAMPQAFKADKAGSWNANMHFQVGGAGTYSLIVESGACTAHDGAHGTTTGVIEIDSVDTILGMAEGTVNPQQAFMGGKIKAQNMGDLMKFSTSFSMSRAKKLADEVMGGGSDDAAPGDDLGQAFQRMPEFFVPEKAGSWATTIHFDIAGAGIWTLKVADGVCTTSQGSADKADCTISYDSADTFLGVVTGSVNPTQAFMSGKMKADNQRELMKFAQCFDLAKAQKAASSTTEKVEHTGTGMNRACIGKTFRQEASFVRPDWAIDYAKSTNDTNPLYMEGKIAPMLYPVRPNIFAVGDAVTDPDLNADLVLLLHGEQDMHFFDTLKPWDLVAPRAEILDIEDKSSGQLLKVSQRIMRDGEVVCETISGFYVRNSATGGSKKKAPKEAPPERTDYLFSNQFSVDDDQSYRYAEASLDKNPIHVDDNVAKAAGHKGVILHGLCTMAMTGKEIINELCDGDATRLKRLKVRFSKTVYPGDTLTTRAWPVETQNGVTTVGLETLNQNGDLVISNALAEIQEA